MTPSGRISQNRERAGVWVYKTASPSFMPNNVAAVMMAFVRVECGAGLTQVPHGGAAHRRGKAALVVMVFAMMRGIHDDDARHIS